MRDSRQSVQGGGGVNAVQVSKVGMVQVGEVGTVPVPRDLPLTNCCRSL